jgi:hypothetical protein
MNKIITQEIQNSIPLQNNFEILSFMVDNFKDAYVNNKKNLSSYLAEDLTRIFQKHNKILMLEKSTKVWVISYEDLTFNIFTAKGKGTNYEVIGEDYKILQKKEIKEKCLTFLKELYKKINEDNIK